MPKLVGGITHCLKRNFTQWCAAELRPRDGKQEQFMNDLSRYAGRPIAFMLHYVRQQRRGLTSLFWLPSWAQSPARSAASMASNFWSMHWRGGRMPAWHGLHLPSWRL